MSAECTQRHSLQEAALLALLDRVAQLEEREAQLAKRVDRMEVDNRSLRLNRKPGA